MQMSRRRPPRGIALAVVAAAVLVVLALVAVPVAAIFAFALEDGFGAALRVLARSDVHAALALSALAALVTVPFVTVFGTAVAWVVTRTDLPGRKALLALVNVPFAVPPVVSGLLVILTLGPRTPVGAWFASVGIPVCFAPPAILLATALVSLGVVAKDLVPLLEALGPAEEQAALSLGASSFQAFWRVTFPGLRLPLLHAGVGALARALGEFGSVTVVSGRIRGETMTVPLLIEALYGEYEKTAAFALAALLAIVALGAVALKKTVELALARGGEQVTP
jgi:sulfate/thiosulfate transport system permease protein